MKNWPWSTILAIVSGLSGIVGTVITPIWGAKAGNDAQVVLQALSGLLIILAGTAATHVATVKAKARLAAVK